MTVTIANLKQLSQEKRNLCNLCQRNLSRRVVKFPVSAPSTVPVLALLRPEQHGSRHIDHVGVFRGGPRVGLHLQEPLLVYVDVEIFNVAAAPSPTQVRLNFSN